MPLPSLVGLAHGSRHPHTVEVIETMMIEAGAILGVEGHAAFLENSTPSPADVACQLATHGARQAVFVPLLFTEAYHATDDTPATLRRAAQSSGISCEQAPILGTGEDIVDVLLDHLSAHSAQGPLLLLAIGSSRPDANRDIYALGQRLQTRLINCGYGAPESELLVRVAFATKAPRAREVISASSQPLTVLPLVTAPGTLLDRIKVTAEDAGGRCLPPLGSRLAPIVAQRYRSVVDANEPVR
ncbi:sirohydrochlorin chelatase [Devriesea agamarum]|uniref:sirohydrochlorin chelatase n=1 Tax=Devriesea agamarum TaxID=472569 RepID=UPI00155E1F79|nr:sirohydrochlorin chelatase [Devriesea agamarum]